MILKNKTAIITGAANGIGKKIAVTLYEKGCQIVCCDINEELLQANFSGLNPNNVLLLYLDVSQPQHWENVVNATLQKFNTIDILLNSAGIIEPGFIHETSLEKVNRQVDINLKGTIYGVHFVSRIMANQKAGHIINISSIAGIAPVPGLNIYSATKFGVRGFSLAVAQELQEHQVKVSVICPDAVKTNMLDYQKDKKEAALTFSSNKILTVDDLNQTILYLLAKPKYEVWLPKSRGVLATIAALFPKLTSKLKNKLIKKGLKKQNEYS